jgi:hypothetical protein
MAAPERFAEMPDFSLAPRAPSIHGTSRHSLRRKICRLLEQQQTNFGLKVESVGSV